MLINRPNGVVLTLQLTEAEVAWLRRLELPNDTSYEDSVIRKAFIDAIADQTPKCCCCGTTEGLRKDGWYGYRCGSSSCIPF